MQTPEQSPAADAGAAERPTGLRYNFNFFALIAIHLITIYAFVRGPTWKLIALAAALYVVRMFGVTAVYHRYFSHRAFKTSRSFQLLLALLGTSAAQKGPLWWASMHRLHHKYSDTERDIHSPLRRGFFYSHMGWWLGRDHEKTDTAGITDFAAYPELRWLDKHHIIGSVLLSTGLLVFGGVDALLWGYVVSTCVLFHGTFTINSLAHVFGSRRFATTDTSRNNLWLALITLGEGWHNNHHHYMSSASQGFYWWEIDVTFYVLKLLEKIGLIWDVRAVPEHILKRNLITEVGERAPLLMTPRPPAAEPSLSDAE